MCIRARDMRPVKWPLAAHERSRLHYRDGSSSYFISKIPEIPFDIPGDASQIAGMKLDDAAARLEALGNPTRLKIYRTLVRAGQEGMPVGRLQARLDIA